MLRSIVVILQISPQCNRLVMLSISSAEQQRHALFSNHRQQWIQQLGLRIQLGKIPPLKLIPFFRIMSEPFAQLRAGSQILVPPVKLK